ncbi:MAG: cold shock domain-containing protein [Anaerolinea sp.]|nr:cold shock domain-containing protein [Anaerolinea sp.]
MQRKLSRSGLPANPDSLAQLDEKPVFIPEKREKPSETIEIEGPAAIQIDPQTGKYIGQVKWYNARKGYGFIMRGAGEEIFFHKTGSVGNPVELNDGQWVLYDVEDTKKGPEATDVELYEGNLRDLPE